MKVESLEGRHYSSISLSPQIYALSYAAKWRVSSTADWEVFPSECGIFGVFFEMNGHSFINLQLQIK